jgi:GntP family gluconate:H+ symporter
MYVQTIIILAAMSVILIAGSFFKKVPMALFLVLAAVVGALIGGFGLPIRHLVEGTQVFLYLMLIVAAGMLFMDVIKASGALDALTRVIVQALHRQPALLLSLLMVLIMLPAMLTGSAPAAVLSTGVLVAPILIRLGIPKAETAAILAMGSIYGLVAPPINVPAMIIATGVYMPYEGFFPILLALTLPLAIFTVLFLGRKYVKTVDVEEVVRDLAPPPPKRTLIIHIPLLAVLVLMVAIRSFPEVIPDLGTPLVFLIGTILGLFTGKRFNVLKVAKESMANAVTILSLFAAVGILIQILTLTGVRGLLVLASLSMGGALLYVAIAVSTILLGGPLMPFGVSAVLGIPFVLAFMDKNTIVVTSAISLIIGVGCLIPPTAIGGLFAARVVGVEKYSQVLAKTLVPALATIAVGVGVLAFAGPLGRIFY